MKVKIDVENLDLENATIDELEELERRIKAEKASRFEEWKNHVEECRNGWIYEDFGCKRSEEAINKASEELTKAYEEKRYLTPKDVEKALGLRYPATEEDLKRAFDLIRL